MTNIPTTPFTVFVTREIPEAGLALLREQCNVDVNLDDGPLERSELLARAAQADVVIGLLTDRINAEFFDAATKLKGYANYAVGFDNIDVPEATRRGLPVSNTPDVLTQATAELAWTLMMSLARRVVETDRIMRSGQWSGWGPLQFIGADMQGKTLGIVGAGRIGTATAMLSRGFDMKVLYLKSPSGRANETLEGTLGATMVDFDTLLAESDFISVHSPLNEGTRHLFDAAAFRKMKPTAYIVNTARGPIINENHLVTALKNGDIAGAGLDVYEKEPAMADGLAECDNAILLPHIGSATHSSRDGMAILAAKNALAMLNGEKPLTCLNPELFD